ncbi:septum site-determining protein MinC [Dellaglioa algida]|uniref:septum site-determining protein MinC n=1 Tax=Dellaglioa algida TaxID=105612 RepID=UPI000BCBB380|nr:septum site-determining protein MinC [Dellaglioa algida]MDK1728979.1 cell division inhibitor [Dellaglioa algida]MDK1741413.1 cell division inhibitor [Dellaglioa algida]SOB50047.1 Cell division inhibitor [Dellaglioa algida]
MQSVILKGYKDGYEIILKQDFGLDKILVELRELFDNLSAEKKNADDTVISFDIKTENRLFTAEEKQKIEKIISEYHNFKVHKIESEVMTIEDANILKENDNVHLSYRTIRSGQIVDLKGDVLFLGKLHQGGQLRATGNIFVMGEVQGVIHAGFENDTDSIIVGNVSAASQVRIGELVDIIDDEKVTNSQDTVIYVNDLHIIDYGNRDELKSLRPKLFNQTGGY